jgi:UDP-N-acetylmuramate--alanine ligase
VSEQTADPGYRTVLTPGPVITRSEWPADPLPTSAHVLFVGGAGMSAVARLLLARGLAVSGSDAVDGQFIAPLRAAGAEVHLGYDAAHLGAPDVVVTSTAARGDNAEIAAAHARGIPVVHRAAALAAAIGDRPLLAVAGTHGKTTTTALAVMALRGAGTDPGWAVGARVPQLEHNAGLGAGPFVAEADESDGSFLALAPQVAVVTNLEPDHLDFHGTEERLVAAFDAFVARLPPDGTLVVCADSPGAADLGDRAEASGRTVVRYGTRAGADWRLQGLDSRPGGSRAELSTPRGPATLDLAVVGRHNVLNAVGALAGAVALGHALPGLVAGVASFRGASRRFDLAGTPRGIAVYDDYAHHPSEIAVTLDAARDVAGQGRVLALFQPHLFSRTRLLADDFATALAAADDVVVLDVYGAREDPEPGVTGALVADRIRVTDPANLVAFEPDREAAVALVAGRARPGDVVVLLGAGDVVELTPALVAALAAGLA